MGDSRGIIRILVGKPEGKRPLGRPRYRRVDLQDEGCEDTGWINVSQDRDSWRALENAIINLQAP
jgi:hypothetical protein